MTDGESVINHIDHKYILLIGTKLDLFKPIGDNIFNFRCPFCLDSKKNKFKKRGYFYPRDDTASFKCHNCGLNLSFTDFLKDERIIIMQYSLDSNIVTDEHVSNTQINPPIIEKWLSSNWITVANGILSSFTTTLTSNRCFFWDKARYPRKQDY